MIAWFARNSVAANLLMWGILIGGLVALSRGITLEVFPPAEPDTISVNVTLRGATPEDVELGVAVRIEEAVQDLEGIEKITSRSVEGGTRVQIEVEPDYDPREVLDDIKSRIDAINTFPAEAEKPVVALAVRRMDVIDVVVAGDYSEDEIRMFADQVRADLLRIDGVTQAELDFVRKYEIAIEASQDRLREFDITLRMLADAVRGSSVDLSAGNVRTDGGDVLIRSKGQAYRQADFETIVVKTNPDGSIVRVGDVANVIDGFEEESVTTRFNGNYAALIGVARVGDQNAIEIAGKVREYIDSRQGDLPVGMELTYWDDDSVTIKNRLNIMFKSAIQGSLLVIILLSLFLRPAIAIWVFLGIPISFIGAFMALSYFGISLNLMSAFGFILVLGIVVDDAIVTGENVYTHLRTKDSGLAAAIRGTKEVAIPVTFGVLTTIAAFVPLGLIDGRLGRFFSPIPAVVIPVLLISLIESKLVLPAHLKHVKIRENHDSGGFSAWQSRFAQRFEDAIIKYYKPVLQRALRHRYVTVATFTGVLLVMATLVAGGWTRWTFFPTVESETATASLEMPVGTPFEVTDKHIQRMVSAAIALQERYTDPDTGRSMITNILSSTGASRGTGGTHVGRVQFETAPREERTIDFTITGLNKEWRELVGLIPGAEAVTFRATWFRPGAPIDVQFSGNSLDELNSIGNEVKQRLTTYPGVFEISDSLSDGKEELRVELTPQGHVLGLTRNDIVGQVGQAFKGLQAQRIQRGRDDIRVLIRYPIDERKTISSLNEMLIAAPNGRLVPLSNVATLQPGRGPSQITRIDHYRVLNVTADVDKEEVNMTVLQADLRAFIDSLVVKYPSVRYTMEGEQSEQRKSFSSLITGLIVVLGVIYCLLALPLKSYVQPLVVMSVIPFGVIGAIIGHWLMGYSLSILSLLGFMALVGVVINDSLVLVDFSNQHHRAGEPVETAVERAGIVRFRPVMLTSVTTFMGLLPLLMERSTTAQFLIPMAISLGFGILFATLITLILVPTNILIAHELGERLRNALGLPIRMDAQIEPRPEFQDLS